MRISSIRLRSFGLMPLCSYDTPLFHVRAEHVLLGANLHLVENDRSRVPLSLRTSRPYPPRTQPSLLHPSMSILGPVRALAFISKTRHSSVGICSNRSSAGISVSGRRPSCWSIRNDEINCLALTSQLQAHRYKPFVNNLVCVPRLTAQRFLHS